MTTRPAPSCMRRLGPFAMLGAYAPETQADHEMLVARPMVRRDGRRLKRLLFSLLSDAINVFKPEDTLKVRRAGSGEVFQASDTGIGITSKDILEALSQFGRVDNNVGRQSDGADLGLLLASGLVELHGGSLHLRSEPGVGTTVTVRLPAA